jgi:hypothetical protein
MGGKMINKILACLFGCFFAVSAFGASSESLAPRVSIFSTSTDWEAVTGRMLNEYHGTFRGKSSLIGRGLMVYYLDGFPCYGLGDSVQAWISPNGESSHRLRLACIAVPKTINFAWVHASRDADDQTTTGIMTCKIHGDGGRDFEIDLADCTRGPDWDDYE